MHPASPPPYRLPLLAPPPRTRTHNQPRSQLLLPFPLPTHPPPQRPQASSLSHQDRHPHFHLATGPRAGREQRNACCASQEVGPELCPRLASRGPLGRRIARSTCRHKTHKTQTHKTHKTQTHKTHKTQTHSIQTKGTQDIHRHTDTMTHRQPVAVSCASTHAHASHSSARARAHARTHARTLSPEDTTDAAGVVAVKSVTVIGR